MNVTLRQRQKAGMISLYLDYYDQGKRKYNLLRELAKEKGTLGQIFTKSQNKITDTTKLYKLIGLINAEQWVLMGVKDKGDIYEGLLEKMQKIPRVVPASTLHQEH